MGMSTHVVGFRPPDEKWQKMAAIWAACETAGVEPPDEVADFFNHESPDPRGIEVAVPITEWNDPDGGRVGYEVAISDIPSNVTHLRFYNSW